MGVLELAEEIKKSLGTEVVLSINESSTPASIEVNSVHIKSLLDLLNKDERFYFDMLSCITGIDNGPEADTMEVVYNLYSIPFEQSLMIKVILKRTDPKIDSVVDIWKTADWLERETYDMYGIQFIGHPDLRRILLPADWKGFPLRKDYEHEEEYRGIKIKY
jgi:NADH-quinone oxidoreductase subunit C